MHVCTHSLNQADPEIAQIYNILPFKKYIQAVVKSYNQYIKMLHVEF